MKTCQLHTRITVGSWLDHQHGKVLVGTNTESAGHGGPTLSGSQTSASTKIDKSTDGSPNSLEVHTAYPKINRSICGSLLGHGRLHLHLQMFLLPYITIDNQQLMCHLLDDLRLHLQWWLPFECQKWSLCCIHCTHLNNKVTLGLWSSVYWLTISIRSQRQIHSGSNKCVGRHIILTIHITGDRVEAFKWVCLTLWTPNVDCLPSDSTNNF